MASLIIAALIAIAVLGLLLGGSGDGTQHSCHACGATVWNDMTFPNHGWVRFSAGEIGLRSLPNEIAHHDGEKVCVVCRNQFSGTYGFGDTV